MIQTAAAGSRVRCAAARTVSCKVCRASRKFVVAKRHLSADLSASTYPVRTRSAGEASSAGPPWQGVQTQAADASRRSAHAQHRSSASPRGCVRRCRVASHHHPCITATRQWLAEQKVGWGNAAGFHGKGQRRLRPRGLSARRPARRPSGGRRGDRIAVRRRSGCPSRPVDRVMGVCLESFNSIVRHGQWPATGLVLSNRGVGSATESVSRSRAAAPPFPIKTTQSLSALVATGEVHGLSGLAALAVHRHKSVRP